MSKEPAPTRTRVAGSQPDGSGAAQRARRAGSPPRATGPGRTGGRARRRLRAGRLLRARVADIAVQAGWPTAASTPISRLSRRVPGRDAPGGEQFEEASPAPGRPGADPYQRWIRQPPLPGRYRPQRDLGARRAVATVDRESPDPAPRPPPACRPVANTSGAGRTVPGDRGVDPETTPARWSRCLQLRVLVAGRRDSYEAEAARGHPDQHLARRSGCASRDAPAVTPGRDARP